MRLACGGIQHETNTFALVPTRLEDFEQDSDCGADFSGGEVDLNLNGAMVTDEFKDAEGVILDAVRSQIGTRIPLFATLDLHANITPRMADLADCLIGFDTYPHVDMRDRGWEAVELARSDH